MSKLILPDREIAQHLRNAGFTGFQLVNMTAIILAENGGDAHAVNVVDKNPASPAYLSLDIGLCSLNTHWWPRPSIRERLTPASACREAKLLWQERFDRARARGLSWTDASNDAYSGWNVFGYGWHTQFLDRAKDAGPL